MTTKTSAPIITFKDFTFRYESQVEPTLHDINLTINRGETVLITGQSGSGKSTLAQCINGLIPHQYEGEIHGQVTVNGIVPKESSLVTLSFEVGTLLQDTDGQFTGLTVAEDVAFARENDAVAVDQMHHEVAQWADTLRLNELLNHAPQQLSGGQKQRVALAGVLISQPGILVLDEPLASLDPKAGQATMKLLRRVAHEHGLTVIIVEHRIEEVLAAGVDRVVVLADGRIVADETPDALLTQPVLQKYGLKIPQYLMILKAAGVDVEQLDHLATVTQLTLPAAAQQQVAAWQQRQPALPEKQGAAPLLTVNDVTFSYQLGARNALDHISTTVHRGEMISIVGQNGAGKSTFLQALCGFIKAAGTLTWHGKQGDEDLAAMSIKQRADHIGLVLQDPNQMVTQKMIFDEVALGLRLRGVPEEEVSKRVLATLKACHLAEFRDWPVAALSFGQKKRLSIAAILVLQPELLILDEPTAGQDAQNAKALLDFAAELNRTQGISIMLVTHDMPVMLQYTQRALVFDHGHIIADKSPFALLADEQLLQTSALLPPSSYYLAQKCQLDPTQLAQAAVAFQLNEEDEA